jgi:hypothetical protein
MRIKLFLIFILTTIALTLFGYVHLRPYQSIASNTQAPPRGVYHQHTTASHDGYANANQIYQTADELNLEFLVVTDHNQMANLESHSNLVVLNYPELSTPFGHVVGFGLKSPLPKTLRENWLVLDEIHSRGGKAIIAHPTRRRNPWQGSWESVGGVEIHNIADQLQNKPLHALRILTTFAANPALAKAMLFKRDHKALSRWDDFSDPAVIGICANDSHGRLNLRQELDMWTVELDAPWPKNRRERELIVIHAIATGKFHCTSSIIEHGGGFEFSALLHTGAALLTGQSVAQSKVDALIIKAPDLASDKISIALYRNGAPIALSHRSTFHYPKPSPGTYRVEIHASVPRPIFGQDSIPVIYSNKIQILE